LNLKELPESLVIIGAGVIGCEFASVFSELGTKVTMVEALDRVLPMVDEEISKRFTMLLKKKKIGVQTSVMVEKVAKGENGVVVSLNNGKELVADKVLIGIGRTLNSKGIGLEEVGVQLGQRGEIVTDLFMKTSVDNIYAIGDVNNKALLAHAASAQGLQVVENILKNKSVEPDVSFVPNCIYTFPEIASIGISEAEAAAQGEIRVGKFPFSACGKALCIGEKDGFIKIIAEADSDKILGVHIIGPHATDLIAEAVLAVRMGLTVEDIAKTIHAHPTISESMMEAAEAVHGLAVHAI
ncbi:MAG: FAD-dependent oxidoreductase, partial [Fusobacteria bacterium]|nr:FAD-dependent oxidoreductase [Fusobacteriota bacterium]